MTALRLFPGVALSALLALVATLLARWEEDVLGRAWVEPMVLAILLGMVVANIRAPSTRFGPGVEFSAKFLLDMAVALLGATLSWAAVSALGAPFFALIAAIVMVALVAVYAMSRALSLNRRLAILIAAGNAICGNSAIAAVAPIVGARREEVTAAIALTALIGVVTVLLLPLAVWVGGLDVSAYAMLVGLSVYAVPQVVAAAAPFGTGVIALATLVKLARVVMLGPLTLFLALIASRFHEAGEVGRGGPRFYLPWFIIAFAGLAVWRSTGVIGSELAAVLGQVSKGLAIVAMAALGLGVRLAAIRQMGPRVAAASAGAAALLLMLAGTAALLVG